MYMEYYSTTKMKRFWYMLQMDEPEDIMLVKEARDKRTNTAWFHLYEAPRTDNFIEAEVDYKSSKIGGGGSVTRQIIG